MSATVTVTGVIGPGNTLTSKVFSNVTCVKFDCVSNALEIMAEQGPVSIDIHTAATITATKVASTNTYTFAIS